MVETENKIFGILAEFRSTGDLLHAAGKVREAGYTRWDTHSPFPIHGMDRAMGLGRSRLGFIVGVAAAAGLTAFGLFLYWINVYAYPLVISGKPFFSYQAFVPPMFAITILSAALTAFFGMLALNRLPRLFHPLFGSRAFERVSTGGFFVSIESDDPMFRQDDTAQFLKSIGAVAVEVVREEDEA